jgi:hypothetical protein
MPTKTSFQPLSIAMAALALACSGLPAAHAQNKRTFVPMKIMPGPCQLEGTLITVPVGAAQKARPAGLPTDAGPDAGSIKVAARMTYKAKFKQNSPHTASFCVAVGLTNLGPSVWEAPTTLFLSDGASEFAVPLVPSPNTSIAVDGQVFGPYACRNNVQWPLSQDLHIEVAIDGNRLQGGGQCQVSGNDFELVKLLPTDGIRQWALPRVRPNRAEPAVPRPAKDIGR